MEQVQFSDDQRTAVNAYAATTLMAKEAEAVAFPYSAAAMLRLGAVADFLRAHCVAMDVPPEHLATIDREATDPERPLMSVKEFYEGVIAYRDQEISELRELLISNGIDF